MMEHYNITVSGRVQGVFYRAKTKKKAEELGLTGWVRNEHNGDVYIEAEGDKDKLETFLAWCHNGPARAEVSEVVCDSTTQLKGFDQFEIKYS